MKRCLFYGSLRRNGFNFNRFGGQIYITTLKLGGFEMYDLNHYPAVCIGDGFITCELHSVENKSFEYIKQMEIGANYKEIEIGDNNTKNIMFIMDKYELKNYQRISSGNWQ